MNEKSAAERAHDVTEFIHEIIDAAEIRMKMHAVDAIVLAYPREEIALLKTCREQCEAMLEWKDHARRNTLIGDGIAAIAAIRATARAAGERIAISMNTNIVLQLRGCMPFLVEYEVLKEKDHLYSKRGRGRS